LSTYHGQFKIMDRNTPQPENELLVAVFAAGQRLGLHWDVVKHRPRQNEVQPDAHVRLRFGDQELIYAAEVKRTLRPATLGVVLHQLAAYGKQALLVTDHVTPPLADELRAREVQFVDAAGNAYLNQPPLLVWVKGQRPMEPVAAHEGTMGRAFQASGLRVLLTLLCNPELVNRPYREIARLTGVAHGTVGWVMPELPRLGYIAEINGKRRLLNPERLLKQWVEAYIRTLRPKLLLGRYRAETLDWTEDFDGNKYGLLLGGEPAARQLTGHLRPETATLYGAIAEPRLLLDKRLRGDRNGNVEILRRFWRFDGEQPGLAPTALIYADLLAIGDARCIETAALLHERITNRFV
jgi:hypothetical protein